MASLEDIINNPNFGRAYTSSYGFQSLFRTQLESQESVWGDILPVLKIHSVGNEVRFSFADDARGMISKNPDESMSGYLIRVMNQRREEGFTRVRRYNSSLVESTRTGKYVDPALTALAEKSGIKLEIFSMPTAPGLSDRISSLYGDDIFIIPDTKTSTGIVATDVRTGKRINTIDFQKRLGLEIDETKPWAKRIKSLFNEHSLKDFMDASVGRHSILTVDSETFFRKNDPNAIGNVNKLLKETNEYRKKINLPELSADDFAKDVFEKMADGQFFTSRQNINIMIEKKRQVARQLMMELEKLPKNSWEYRKLKDQIDKIGTDVRNLRKASSEGTLSGISRLYNAAGYKMEGGDLIEETIEHAKGEVRVLSDEHYAALLRTTGVSGTDEELIKRFGFFSTREQLKQGEIGPVLRDKMSVFTFEPTPPVKKMARSSMTTTAALGDIAGDSQYLFSNLGIQLRKQIQDIKSGNITPALMKLINNLEDVVPEDMSPADAQKFRETQAFVRRFKEFVEGGGDITREPYLMKQLLQQVQDHYFSIGKGKSRVRFGGETALNLDISFPTSAKSAHLYPGALLTVDKKGAKLGMLALDEKIGAFILEGMDPYMLHKTFGGFDFDDSFFGGYVYDSQSKKLMRNLMRHPTAMGEFFFAEVSMKEIAEDEDIPTAIKQLARRHEEIIDELNKVKHRNTKHVKRADKLVKELNQVKRNLDSFFAGRTTTGVYKRAISQGEDIQELVIQQLNLKKAIENGLPAPNSFSWNMDLPGVSPQMSFQQLSGVSTPEDLTKLRTQLRYELTNNRLGGDARLARFIGHSKDTFEYYNRFFDFVTPDSTAGKAAATRAKRFSSTISFEAQKELLDSLSKESSLLGQLVNFQTTVDSFVQNYMDWFNKMDTSQEFRQMFEEVFKSHNIRVFERELIIDMTQMKYDADVMQIAKATLEGPDSNFVRLGRAIKEVRERATQMGLDIPIGLDPVFAMETFDPVFGIDPDGIRKTPGKISRENLKIMDDIAGQSVLLDEKSPRAFLTRLFSDKLSAYGDFTDEIQQAALEVTEKLSQDIGFDFTEKQLLKARTILDNYEEGRKLIREIDPNEIFSDEIAQLMDDLGDSAKQAGALDRLSQMDLMRSREGLHLRTFAQMQGMTASDIKAVARVMIDSGSDFSLLNQATLLPDSKLTVMGLYQRALNEDSVLSGLRNAKSLEDLNPYLKFIPETGEVRFTQFGESVIDYAARNAAAVDAITRAVPVARMEQMMAGPVSGTVHTIVPSSSRGVYAPPTEEIKAYREFAETIAMGPQLGAVPDQFGEFNATMRATADEMANEVTKGAKYSEKMRRLSWKDISNAKAAKRGLVIAGAFMGVGIVHRLVTGDRSVDAMDPYPLVPENSKYESILDQGRVTTQPVNYNGNMSYRIRVAGIDNERASTLSSLIQGVLPQGGTTIYNSNAYSIDDYSYNSSSILNERLGR